MVGREESGDAHLSNWVNDTLGALEDDACPSAEFGEVMRRAHEMNDAVVDASMLERALDRISNAPGDATPLGTDDIPEGLEAFVDDARRAADKAVAQRRRPVQSHERRGAGGLSRWTAVAAIALALVGLGFALARSRGSTTQEHRVLREAVLSADLLDAAATATTSRRPRITLPQPVVSVVPSPVAELKPETVSPALEPKPVRRSPSVRRRLPADTLDETPAPDPLRELDQAAQTAWRKGDLQRATSLFEQVIIDGRGTKWVQLAYGDLFALARQRGRPGLEESRWTEYLDAYPHGPHADDAQAGLCRRATGAERSGCWQRYLDTYPKGAHRRRGVRALEAMPRVRP